MSGGSYNYLYSRELGDGGTVEDLRCAQQRLKDLGYADDAAGSVAVVLRMLEDAEQKKAALEGVLHALEWWDSNDWSEDQFREALAKFRAAGDRED
ncbi:hypothetical protein ACFYY5_29170 [Nocardia elegans]|uniref:Uncharacterized protein n=1 Tax=Nocardia elegans TaxID=300029 RepID=A0ABW6TNL2_9NOCA